jgi:hypothetical protein
MQISLSETFCSARNSRIPHCRVQLSYQIRIRVENYVERMM